uniref:MFS domain-containing protein n=1 Tax=Steinernema glaseri TaxID=37863 RepID=A0A1I7ZNQ4_9BILA
MPLHKEEVDLYTRLTIGKGCWASNALNYNALGGMIGDRPGHVFVVVNTCFPRYSSLNLYYLNPLPYAALIGVIVVALS